MYENCSKGYRLSQLELNNLWSSAMREYDSCPRPLKKSIHVGPTIHKIARQNHENVKKKKSYKTDKRAEPPSEDTTVLWRGH